MSNQTKHSISNITLYPAKKESNALNLRTPLPTYTRRNVLEIKKQLFFGLVLDTKIS